jgi:tryptophan-rich sensory protein
MLPYVIVWLIGLVLSLVYWQRNPKVSRLALVAFAGFLITSFIFTFLRVRLPVTFQERNLSASRLGTAYTTINVISSPVSAGLWGPLLAAIFGRNGRGENQDAEQRNDTAKRFQMSENKDVSSASQTKKPVGAGLLVTGWIFSVLGGFVGIAIAIASSIAFGKKYDEESRVKGRSMFITAIILFVIYVFIRIAVKM